MITSRRRAEAQESSTAARASRMPLPLMSSFLPQPRKKPIYQEDTSSERRFLGKVFDGNLAFGCFNLRYCVVATSEIGPSQDRGHEQTGGPSRTPKINHLGGDHKFSLSFEFQLPRARKLSRWRPSSCLRNVRVLRHTVRAAGTLFDVRLARSEQKELPVVFL